MGKILALIAVVIIAAVLVLVRIGDKEDATPSSNQPIQTSENTNQDVPSQTITYNEVGFSPEMLTIRAGGSLIIENKSSDNIEVYSSQHPDHMDNPELNYGQINSGESLEMTATATGTFTLHTEDKPDKSVKVVVQP